MRCQSPQDKRNEQDKPRHHGPKCKLHQAHLARWLSTPENAGSHGRRWPLHATRPTLTALRFHPAPNTKHDPKPIKLIAPHAVHSRPITASPGPRPLARPGLSPWTHEGSALPSTRAYQPPAARAYRRPWACAGSSICPLAGRVPKVEVHWNPTPFSARVLHARRATADDLPVSFCLCQRFRLSTLRPCDEGFSCHSARAPGPRVRRWLHRLRPTSRNPKRRPTAAQFKNRPRTQLGERWSISWPGPPPSSFQQGTGEIPVLSAGWPHRVAQSRWLRWAALAPVTKYMQLRPTRS